MSTRKVASILIGLALWHSSSALAAEIPFIEGQVIVRFAPQASAKSVLNRLDRNLFADTSEVLVPDLNLHLLKLKPGVGVKQALARLKSTRQVLYSQADHQLSLREKSPNDPQFAQQWHLKSASGADIRATQAWELGTGGQDADHNDIVIAIVDGGMDITHKDLAPNLWTNPGEVGGNGVDDDGDGYIDDVHGWNAFTNTGTIPTADHGTHVAGIAGAKGDNATGVTGINWNVKLMPIAASSGTTSVVMKGYNYALTLKKLWLSSNGQKGANVVVTNSSFGVDFAKCESGDFPVWNDMYNSLGQAGILSAAATANNNVDVDVQGDVPTGCSSPYMISVTNTTSANIKYLSSGYGKTTIDLGAPGTDVLSTIPGNTTGKKTGTSMSTPNVAGSVAFMHSVASAAFRAKMKENPADGALALKQILLSTVDTIPSLANVTVSGGRLNLAKASQTISTYNGTSH